jgi:hypothetical protein
MFVGRVSLYEATNVGINTKMLEIVGRFLGLLTYLFINFMFLLFLILVFREIFGISTFKNIIYDLIRKNVVIECDLFNNFSSLWCNIRFMPMLQYS